MNNITTVLQLFKRQEYLSEQIDAVLKQTRQSNIIAVHNEGGVDIEYPDQIDHVIYSSVNMKFHLRFAVGLLFDTEYIAFLDDDTIPQPQWYENCINTIQKHDCLCVTNGRTLLPNGQWLAPGWGNPNEDEILTDFGGHAWFLRTKNLKYMWYDNIEEYKNGEDIMLSANLQIHANIPTYVPPHPLRQPELWGSDPVKAAKYGSDSVAHWITQPTHYQERHNLMNHYINKGWKLQHGHSS